MNKRENREDINNPEESLFQVDFPDKSAFNLPKQWEAVFVDCFGSNPKNYPIIAKQLTLIAGKYKEHHAYPDKLDGLFIDDESLRRYDNPEYYTQKWENVVVETEVDVGALEKSDLTDWEIFDRIVNPEIRQPFEKQEPTMAEIAREILSVAIRPSFMQQVMQEFAESRGEKPPLVINAEQIQEEIQSGDNLSQGVRLVINSPPLLKHLTPYINWPKE